MSHARQETQDKDSVQEPCFIEPENYCGAYIHLKNSTPLKHFKPEKKHPCGMSQCSLRFKRRQELEKQHARTFGFATRILTSGHKLMYTSILMPDYVSRYKHSSIHIFSYILFLHTFFIYIYIKTYISIYLYINLCFHSYGSESTLSTGFMSILEEQSEKRSMLSFFLACISQDPWRALRSKLISRL